jgi:hypothetical protein
MIKDFIDQMGIGMSILIFSTFSILGFILIKLLYHTWPMIYWFFFCPWW